MLSDEAVMKFSVSGPKPVDEIVEDLEDWTCRHIPDHPQRWAVTTKPEGRFLGFCGFSHHLINGEPFWELGYRLIPSVWGYGFATEAAAACRDWFFRTRIEDHFALMIEPANVASVRIAQKIGARHEFDAVCYGLSVQIYVVRR